MIRISSLLIAVSVATTIMGGSAQSAQGADLTTVSNLSVERGKQEIAAGHVFEAEIWFRRAVAANPADCYAHYYLADVLARTGRHDQALVEYRTSYKLNPTSSVSGYCKLALIAYKDVSPAFIGMPASDELRKKVDRDGERVGSAISTIEREAIEEKNRQDKIARELGRSAVRGGDWKARDIKEQAESEIFNMYNGGLRGGLSDRVLLTPKELERRAKQIRANAEENAARTRQLAEEHSEEHQAWSRARQAELDRVADNLRDQLKSKSSPYGHDLNPVGTGLFVRNYKPNPHKIPLPDARFSVLRLIDRGMSEPPDESTFKLPRPDQE